MFLDIERIYRSTPVQQVLVARRQARARSFLSHIKLSPASKILDVGCGTDGNSLEAVVPPSCEITGIDLLDPSLIKISGPNFFYIQQDAQDLSRFSDNHFDLAVSVGMMEHICDRPKLLRIAKEIRRVARQVVITVPWKFAWIEPHFKLPFFQLLPFPLQLMCVRQFNPQGLADLNPEEYKKELAKNYQWLSTSEWKVIFEATHSYLSPTFETINIIVAKSTIPVI
jgi:ubiquinone/menaquinone biosynthesis C-methylase UbiE